MYRFICTFLQATVLRSEALRVATQGKGAVWAKAKGELLQVGRPMSPYQYKRIIGVHDQNVCT